MTNALEIRTAGPEDFETLLAIDQECFGSGVAYEADELAYFMNRPEASTLVARIGERILGFLVLDTERPRSRDAVGVLVTLDVVEGARGHGIGSLLLDRSEGILRERGVGRYRLQVNTTNRTAIDFYRRKGFGVLGTIEDYYGNGADAHLMEKILEDE